MSYMYKMFSLTGALDFLRVFVMSNKKICSKLFDLISSKNWIDLLESRY